LIFTPQFTCQFEKPTLIATQN